MSHADHDRPLVPMALLAVALAGCSSSAPPTSTPPDLAACVGSACGCAADRDCPAGQRCDPARGACVACLLDADCPTGSVCRASACVKGCSAERGCGDAGACDTDAGACVECLADGDCRDEARPACASGRCVACRVAEGGGADLCGPGLYCAVEDGAPACLPGCKEDRDCEAADGGAGQAARCDLETHRCVACAVDDDCPAGRICRDTGAGLACVDGCSDLRPCAAPSACCDDACVDVGADPAHCGGCGAACPAGWACCAAGEGAACANPASDVENCGGCGVRCAAAHGTPKCAGRACALAACDPGWADCNGVAADGCETHVDVNPSQCGACGNWCLVPHAQAACVGGRCGIETCLGSWADCNGDAADGCESDTRRDLANCGDCGVACGGAHATPACVAGACGLAACDAGHADCNRWPGDGCEASTDSDLRNCGGCGVVCADVNGSASCVAGACRIACRPGFGDCDGDPATGCETNLLDDATSCGACGNACFVGHGEGACVAGACRLTACDLGWSDCNGDLADGCETFVLTDPANCGACGKGCSANHIALPTCGGGVCDGACDAGFASCDDDKQASGCEVEVAVSVDHCGGCGRACPAVAHGQPACGDGVCGIAACDGGWGDCDGVAGNGCEASLQDDATNCGACGNACAADHQCIGGACQPKGLQIQVEGHADVFVPCQPGDYSCQAHYVCNAVTRMECVHQQYECATGTKGSWYPPDGASGDSNFNFAYAYDFWDGNYGNICACTREQMTRYGLAPSYRYCGLGHWFRR